MSNPNQVSKQELESFITNLIGTHNMTPILVDELLNKFTIAKADNLCEHGIIKRNCMECSGGIK